MNAPNLAPGTVVAGKYRVASLLGYSGATAAFRAQGAQGDVVLKMFAPAIVQRPDIMKGLERIYAETNALGQDLAAPILDAGFDPQTSSAYAVTPFLPLPSLAQTLSRAPMALADVSAMLAALARVLDNAHIRQLYHHAIKPTNVFVGAGGRDVRVTDFGAGLARSVVMTHEGYTLAAPWLAPEQVQGTSPPGAAADVFSVALLAFYALTAGSFWRACQGAQPDLNAWQAELFAGRNVASLRASELRVPLHSGLDAVFARALASNPAERYRTLGELAAAFDSVANARTGEAHEDHQGHEQGFGFGCEGHGERVRFMPAFCRGACAAGGRP